MLLNAIPCAAQRTTVYPRFEFLTITSADNMTISPYVIQMCQTSPIYCSMRCIELFLKQIEEYIVNLKVLEHFILTVLVPNKELCADWGLEKEATGVEVCLVCRRHYSFIHPPPWAVT